MYFYEIWVRTATYRSKEALTYQATQKLPVGSIVAVPLQKTVVWGVVFAAVAKPTFTTKPVAEVSPLPPIPSALLLLVQQISDYYASPIGAVIQLILPPEPRSIRTTEPAPTKEVSLDTFVLPPLTEAQKSALKQITKTGTYLLHGITGSGKTRIYLEKARDALRQGLSTIVLTPEISLTSQLAQQFRDIFKDDVVVLHSGLTPRERRETWVSLLKSPSPKIVIGARSALFSPLSKVGLIVVDESHEPAYKQEQAPYYHAVRVASMLAHFHKAILILGSATPSITDYYIAEQKHAPIISWKSLATQSSAAVKHVVVDLTERSLLTRSMYLSDPLIAAIQHSLEHGEQSMLYLNRRGTARVILCDQCGWQALCPHCDLPLTYHADSHNVICHSCSFRGSVSVSCPECGNPSIIYKSAGTKLIVEEVKRLFPEARVQRFDTDNRKAERLEQQYDTIIKGEVDILVGTQLLAKGLDLPRLSTLGVIMADSGLTMPDFSANERTYQLLTQVLGRVGRGHRNSTAIIQTYNTTSVAITAALGANWQLFYKTELAERQKYRFPPFCYLLKLTCRRASQKSAQKSAQDFKDQLHTSGLPLEIDGPAPSFHEKIEGKHQWQLVVKSKERSALIQVIQRLPKSGWSYDIDPVNLL